MSHLARIYHLQFVSYYQPTTKQSLFGKGMISQFDNNIKSGFTPGCHVQAPQCLAESNSERAHSRQGWLCVDSVNSPSNADLPEFLFSSASMTSSVTQRNLRLRSDAIVFAAPQIECVEGGKGRCRAKLRFGVSANIHRRPRPKTCVNTGLEEPVWPSSEKSLSFALAF